MKYWLVHLIAIVIISMATVSCNSSGKDKYLKTLRMKTESIVPIDSIDIEQFEAYQPDNILKIDDNWLLLSSTKGDYNLLFLNTETSERFFAIRRGRGPGEIVYGVSLHKYGNNNAIYYDYNNGICISLDLQKTINDRHPVLDTVGIFKESTARPLYLCFCNKAGFFSGNTTDKNIWYSLYDDAGDILSNVNALHYKELSKNRDFRVSIMLSSKYVAKPDGTKVCVANVASPSLSFSNVNSGIMTEYKRYEIAPPEIDLKRNRTAFCGIDADDSFVYLLYSGHKIVGDTLPSHECNHLIVYNWNGCPVKHYRLSRNISSIHVEGNCLTGSSDYPECKVYKYVLNGLR